jgi:osmoprotectant transport system permease protein
MDLVWLADHLDDLAFRTLQHLGLAALGVAAGFVLSLALSILAVRVRATLGPILTVSGFLYTIPSLALFAALVPVTGLSLLTAEIPLVLYTLLILIRNIVAGLDGVAPDVLEAADGMGYAGRSRLLHVELPLAVPLIVAGVRLAAVSTIGLVVISGIIGDRFGGLGFFIFEGYRHSFATEIAAGAVPSVVLAIVVDRLLVGAGSRLTPWADARATP